MRLGAILALAALATLGFSPAFAQDAGGDAAATERQQARLGEAGADQLIAPIALKGDKLDEALAKQDWDASVKALVATPTVLDMMNEQLFRKDLGPRTWKLEQSIQSFSPDAGWQKVQPTQ